MSACGRAGDNLHRIPDERFAPMPAFEDGLAATQLRWTANTPRAHITNQRAMEIFRDFGVEDQVLADATPHELVGDTVFCTSIAGEEIGRIRTWGTHPAREADYQLASPCLICDIPQTYLEPILARPGRKPLLKSARSSTCHWRP